MSEAKNFPAGTPIPPDQGSAADPWAGDRGGEPYAAPEEAPRVEVQRPPAPSPGGLSVRRHAPAAIRLPGTKARTVWSGIIVAAIVLILLLIFIVQNTDNVTIHFFGLSGQLPIAVALLAAAIAGILLLAIPGTIRMLQLRKAARVERTTEAAPPGASADYSATDGA